MRLIKDFIVISIISIILIGLIYWIDRDRPYVYQGTHEIQQVTIPEEPLLEFNLPVDSFEIVRGKVKRNEFLADILLGLNFSYNEIDRFVKNCGNVLNVRKIRPGQKYTMFYSPDSLQTKKYFVLETSLKDYILCHLSDSMYAEKLEKEVLLEHKQVKGSIESSLWEAMNKSGANPLLAIELSEIYAWTIDFFGIQKQDSFEVIYDEAYVDSVSIGIETVYCSRFKHMGADYYAFRFMQDSIWDYFDEDGASLRKAFLKAPLRYSRISSRFSNSRLHPVLKIRRPHHGIDYAAPTGTPVHAIGDGVIIKRAYQRAGGGNYLKIKHNSVYTSVYMHLSKFGKGMAQGKKVKQGDVIGYVGSTGLATGPHLDFRIFKNGKAVDPLSVKSPPVDPVKPEYKEEFEAQKTDYLRKLSEF